eukprot:TRINITY_DN4387_c0_g1_i1.p2 TRINITY_DN4387_c0_g1~~TRINITY_DN4387_c0_g1_i1.p2  ORF type:complete len:135 (+),score=6.86 TRINITY_DN4387_c0_g1_i1:292-696(+)
MMCMNGGAPCTMLGNCSFFLLFIPPPYFSVTVCLFVFPPFPFPSSFSFFERRNGHEKKWRRLTRVLKKKKKEKKEKLKQQEKATIILNKNNNTKTKPLNNTLCSNLFTLSVLLYHSVSRWKKEKKEREHNERTS